MLKDIGVPGVLLGHSERRQYFGETDKTLQRKLPAALAAGLEPILAVGELEDERERGETERRLRHQVQEAFEHVAPDDVPRVVVAYEPVWAIGTGKVATPDQAQEACGFIRALIRDKYGELADQVRIQYGGSVNDDNAGELLSLPDIDGALVGGASLDPAKFARIVEAAL
jgi:triosephosphate isomerase